MLRDATFWLADLGQSALWSIWVPLLVWSLAAGTALLLDHRLALRRPDLRHRLLVVLLVSLPIGIGLRSWAPIAVPLPTPAPTHVYAELPAPTSTPALRLPDANRTTAQPSQRQTAQPSQLQQTAPTFSPPQPAPPLLWAGLGALTLALIGSSAFGLARWTVRQVRVRRWIGRLRACLPSQARDALQTTARLGVDAPVAFVRDDVTPFSHGLLRPRIVLPISLAGDPDALRLALTHEAAHVRSHDPAWDAAARLACALTPWHPASQALVTRAALRREQAADACVLSVRPSERSLYAHLLLRYAIAPVPVALAAPRNHLTPRVHAMSLRLTSSPSSLPIALLVLLMLSLSLSVRAQEAPSSDVSPADQAKMDSILAEAQTFRIPPAAPPAATDRVFDEWDRQALRIGPDGQHFMYSEPDLITDEARALGVEGDVLVRFVVTKQGTVRDAEVRRGLGAGLDEAALDQVSRYLYRPAERGGESVNVRLLQLVRFRLDSSYVRLDDGKLRLTDLDRTDLGLTGAVVDANGEVVPGATIVMPDAYTSAVTGGDGRFTLIVDGHELLSGVRLSASGYPARIVLLPAREELISPRWEDADGYELGMKSLRIVGSTQTSRGFVGQVLDSDSGEPLVGASVRVGSTQVESVSDDEGRFFLALTDLPPDGTIIVSAPGYDGYVVLDINGLIYAGREMGLLIPMQSPQAVSDALDEEWRARFNPMVSLRMTFSQKHYPVGIERVESDCPELDAVALATAQSMRLSLKPGEAESGEHAYLMLGCNSLRGEPIGASARPLFDIALWVAHAMQNSLEQSAEWPHVLFRADLSPMRRYTSPTVMRSDCPTRNDAALRFVTERMSLMPSSMERWMDYRENLPESVIGFVPCSYAAD